MTIYQRLGIEQEATKKEIKRAYAIKIKQLDLSQDIEAYQLLREAYEEAIKGLTMTDANQYVFAEREVSYESDDLRGQPETVLPIKSVINFRQDLDEVIHQQAYYDDGVLWERLLSPYLEESLQLFTDTRTVVKLFLSENYYLLSQPTKEKIMALCELSAEDWYHDGFGIGEAVLKVNPLSFKEFDCIKQKRERYYYLRQQLYTYLHDPYYEGMSVGFIMAEVKGFQFLDDDFLYLHVLLCLGQSKSAIKSTFNLINNYISRIKGEKYQKDCETLLTIANYCAGDQTIRVSYLAIKELEWAPKRIKSSLIVLIKVRENGPVQEPVKEDKLANFNWRALLFCLFVVMGLFRVVMYQTNRPAKIDSTIQLKQDVLKETETENEEIQMKLDLRKDGQVEFTMVVSDLFSKTEGQEESVKKYFTEKGYVNYLEVKADYHAENVEREDSLIFGSSFSSSLINNDVRVTSVQFNEFADSSSSLAIYSNREGKIEKINLTQTKASKLPGSYTGYTYFRYDLGIYNETETYLEMIRTLGRDYLSESFIMEMTALISRNEDSLLEIRSFMYRNFYVLPLEQKVLAIKKEEEVIFIEFDQNEKINRIYGSVFPEAPAVYLNKVKSVDFSEQLSVSDFPFSW